MNTPIVKNLTSHDMTTNPPAVFVAFTPEPVVAQHLSIEIVCLEGGVVYVGLWAFEEEEAVVVDQLGATVQVEEGGYVSPGRIVNQLQNHNCRD